jgi:PAS domain S-box-containing protein
MMDAKTYRFKYCSDACYGIFGFTPSEVMNFTLMDMFPSEYVKMISTVTKEKVEKFKETGIEPEAKYELQQYHKDGRLRWVELSTRTIANEKGELSEIIGITKEIEERKKLETALKENEEKYRLMAEHTNDMFYTFDVELQKFTFMSGACYELSGFTVEEYLSMTSLKEILPPDSIIIIEDIFKYELDAYSKGNKKASADRIFEMQQYHKRGHLV